MNSKKLYHFMMNNECRMQETDNGVISFMFVKFHNLQEFGDIIGDDYFDNCGFSITLMRNHAIINITELFEVEDMDLFEYKECFGHYWNECMEN